MRVNLGDIERGQENGSIGESDEDLISHYNTLVSECIPSQVYIIIKLPKTDRSIDGGIPFKHRNIRLDGLTGITMDIREWAVCDVQLSDPRNECWWSGCRAGDIT